MPSIRTTSRLAATSSAGATSSVLPSIRPRPSASTVDPAATPVLMPRKRTTFSALPAWPVCSAGAVAMIALLLGEMNRPCPAPTMASASMTNGRLPAVPSRKT